MRSPLTSLAKTQIGAMKCGTTALRGILKRCPNVFQSTAVEPHFFDQLRETEILQTNLTATSRYGDGDTKQMSDERACRMRREYLMGEWDLAKVSKALRDNNPAHLFEKTPSYIRVPGTAAAISRLFAGQDDDRSSSGVKIIALLREPISRFYSNFKFVMTMEKSPKPFLPQTVDEMVQHDIQCMRDVNLTKAPTLYEYNERIGRGEVVPDSEFALWEGLTLEDKIYRMSDLIRKNPFRSEHGYTKNMVFNSLYSLHLAEWLEYFQLGRDLKIFSFENFQEDKEEVLGGIFDFVGLSKACLSGSAQGAMNRRYNRNSAFNSTLSSSTKDYLWRFYKPYNEELADMLGDDWPRQY